MQPHKFRWSKVYESSEEELQALLSSLKIKTERWTASEFEELEPRVMEQGTTIWCAEGSLTVGVMGTYFSLQPGDGLRIPDNATTEIRGGISGCVCYEATGA